MQRVFLEFSSRSLGRKIRNVPERTPGPRRPMLTFQTTHPPVGRGARLSRVSADQPDQTWRARRSQERSSYGQWAASAHLDTARFLLVSKGLPPRRQQSVVMCAAVAMVQKNGSRPLRHCQ